MRFYFLAFAIVTTASLLCLGTALGAATLGSAPEGDPVKVAAKVIHKNFDRAACPKVVLATRLDDGGLRAQCSNGELFRVFTLNGKAFGLRCSAAEAIGITGC